MKDRPKGFTKEMDAVMEALLWHFKDTFTIAKAYSVTDRQLISAVMSATLTSLVELTGCPHCTKVILDDAAELMKDFEHRTELH